MAKTAKLKKSAKTSVHSRASRRATSPSINLDKSLKTIQPPAEPRPVLSVHQGAGVTKRKSKRKQVTRHKRMRHEKGMQRAEAVMDQMEKKAERSLKKERTVKDRSLAWDVVNEGVAPKDKPKQRKALEEDDWEDEDEEGDGSMSDEEVAEAVTTLKVSESLETQERVNGNAEPAEGEEEL